MWVDGHIPKVSSGALSVSQINTIAIVNAIILDSGNENINVVSLIKQLTDATSNLYKNTISVTNNVNANSEIDLVWDESIPVSLIISELLTNASKHNSINDQSAASIKVNIDGDNKHLDIEIVNNINRRNIKTNGAS